MTSTERRTDDRDGYPPPIVTAAVLGLIAALLAIWTVAVIGETSGRAFASYTPVDVTVVDERIEEGLVADRRGSTRAPFRVVTVELPDGVRADLRSDDLAVGPTATVYRSDAGAVFEMRPAPPGPLEWGLSAATLAAAVVVTSMAVRSVGRLRSSRSAGPGARA